MPLISSPSHAQPNRTTSLPLYVVALVVAVLCITTITIAGDSARQSGRTTEIPDDPPGTIIGPRSTSPRAIITFGDYTSIQVNVDNDNNNVEGDAANEPSIAFDPTAPNRIAVGWRQFDTITSNFREAGVSHSIDGGRTWSPIAVLEDGVFRSDPVLAASPDGDFYYLSLTVDFQNVFSCQLFVSLDGGATWPQFYQAVGGDKQWLHVDPNNGYLYQPWNVAGNQYFPAQFSRSTDDGVSWDQPVQYDPTGNPPARPVFGTLDSDSTGRVFVAGVENNLPTDNFWAVRSTNASDPNQTVSFDLIRTIFLGGEMPISRAPNPGGLLGQINVGVDNSGGTYHGAVYILGTIDPPGSDPANIHIIRSFDGGDTWTSPRAVNDEALISTAWQWFGAMDVAPNGRIDVIWNDTRNTGAANMSQLFYSFSTSGGASWSPNVPVSPAFNTLLGFPNQNKIGDYYDIESDLVGAHVIYSATFNGEQDVYYLRIGDYDCNNNGVGDMDDIAGRTSFDCNNNDIPDECEIAAGAVDDINDDGVPDACQPCLADLVGPGGGPPDGVVNVNDLFRLLSNWNTNGPGANLAAPPDIVNVADLFALLAAWGPCP